MDIHFITLFGILFICAMTTLGASFIFIVHKIRRKNKLDAIIFGLCSGIMVSAAIFSMILPALNYTQTFLKSSLLTCVIGILFGALFLTSLNFITNGKNASKQFLKFNKEEINKTVKLFIAVTLHNIPEGLAVGLAFGVALKSGEFNAAISALMLAIGIGIQNFPEGFAVALPIKIATNNTKFSFLCGTLSGIVEPIFALLGILLSQSLPSIMPLLLTFAAGAMIFVVIEDLITDDYFVSNSLIGSWSFIIGFLLMMILDVLFQ